MVFIKGQKAPKKKTTNVVEKVTPILDKGNTLTEQEILDKQELVNSVMKTQSAPPEQIIIPEEKSVNNNNYTEEVIPAFQKSKKVKTMVRIQAIVKKYRDRPFMSCAAYSNSKRKYLTGQEDLTVEELAKQVIIIDPNAQYPVVHGMTLNPDRDEDRIMLSYYKNVEEVATSKKTIKPGVSLFYIENREDEAEEEISFSKLIFDAMSKISQCSLSRMQDIVLMLNLPGSNQTTKQAENLLWKECQKDPKRVLEQFADGKEDELFIRRLLKEQILFQRIGEGIYERLGDGQNMFLGKTIMEAVKFIREANNVNYAARWGQKLKERGIR